MTSQLFETFRLRLERHARHLGSTESYKNITFYLVLRSISLILKK